MSDEAQAAIAQATPAPKKKAAHHSNPTVWTIGAAAERLLNKLPSDQQRAVVQELARKFGAK